MEMTLKDLAALVSIVGVFITAFALWFTIRSFKKQLQLNCNHPISKTYSNRVFSR